MGIHFTGVFLIWLLINIFQLLNIGKYVYLFFKDIEKNKILSQMKKVDDFLVSKRIKLQIDLLDISYFYILHETSILNSFYSLPLTYPLWNCGFALTAARNFYSFHLFYDYSCVNQPASHYYVFQLKRQALISKVKTIP